MECLLFTHNENIKFQSSGSSAMPAAIFWQKKFSFLHRRAPTAFFPTGKNQPLFFICP
jgi:hypothetical protein